MENKIKTCRACSKRLLIHQKKFCSNGCYSSARKVIDLSKPKNTVLSERKSWLLFWDYHLPRMSYEHFGKGKKGGLPKDSFELATYKACELKFNIERFENKRAREFVAEYIPLPLEQRAKMGQH